MTSSYLTPREVADKLRLAKTDGVLALIHRGELPAVNVSAGNGRPTWRIDPADLDRFLARRRAVPTPPAGKRPDLRNRPEVTQYF